MSQIEHDTTQPSRPCRLLREAKIEYQTAVDGSGCSLSYAAGVSKMGQLLYRGSLAASYCVVKLDIYSCTTPDTLSIWLFLSQSLKARNSSMSYNLLFAEPAVPTSELSEHRTVWVGLMFPSAHCPFEYLLRFPGRVKGTLHLSLPEPVNSGLDGPFPAPGQHRQNQTSKIIMAITSPSYFIQS